jgi:hypothetical protein
MLYALATLPTVRAGAAVFPAAVTAKDVARLTAATAFVRGLDHDALMRLVPVQSGLNFVGCANCRSGRQEEQLAWSEERPEELYCRFCRHRYPSAKYPTDQALAVRNPRGETQNYPYWADAAGYRYLFQARRDDLVRSHLAGAARNLALLYAAGGERAHAERAGAIIHCFAEVFPGWCYHYDYPFRQKVIYEGDLPPAKFLPEYRTARWTWWAYMDIPRDLVEAYDWIASAGVLDDAQRRRIEQDLFRNAATQVLANPENYHNMSPRCWHSLVVLGKVIGEPRYVAEARERLERFTATRFFYDGAWMEGAPSYHAQSIGGLKNVLAALDEPESAFPALARSQAALLKMRLPDGRMAPVHDTWWFDKRAPLTEAKPYLLPALGHAALGGGGFQINLTWSGGYSGHQHYDNLALILCAGGRELLSDLGYSHTRYRPWTTLTAAHNTVVIDGTNQAQGSIDKPTDGTLRWFSARNPRVQALSVDGVRGYPGAASVYRRTLFVIDAGDGNRYAVDVFEVEGGRVHDYFLHGDCDTPATAVAAAPLQPIETLLPPGMAWKLPAHENDYRPFREPWGAYGFLRKLRAADTSTGALAVTFQPGLRVTLLPESGSRLVLGENPSIRHADEDDAKLEEFMRPFLMLRHHAVAGRSVFAVVLEPLATTPFVTAAERTADGIRIRIGKREHLISLRERPSVLFEDREVWSLGTRHEGRLAGVESDALILADPPPSPPAAGDVVRVTTADSWTYPFTIAVVEETRLRVVEGPGLTYDAAARSLNLTAFPQRQHAGDAAVSWFSQT